MYRAHPRLDWLIFPVARAAARSGGRRRRTPRHLGWYQTFEPKQKTRSRLGIRVQGLGLMENQLEKQMESSLGFKVAEV